MNSEQRLAYLVSHLQAENPDWRVMVPPEHWDSPDRLYHALVNLRPPWPMSEDWLAEEDIYLSELAQARGRVKADEIPDFPGRPGLALWRGDITRLGVDAIVNAANSGLLGCFIPLHLCIDNVIQSAAGVRMRLACHEIIQAQGHPEGTGLAKITPGYNLPAKYVLHTVGPIVRGPLTERDRLDLASCYSSCLDLAERSGLESIAFCCISTGVFSFPKAEAAAIAIETVSRRLQASAWRPRIIFNVFGQDDYDIYKRLLGERQNS